MIKQIHLSEVITPSLAFIFMPNVLTSPLQYVHGYNLNAVQSMFSPQEYKVFSLEFKKKITVKQLSLQKTIYNKISLSRLEKIWRGT